MSSVLLELTVIFALLLANGLFSMAEIAIVSSRKARLRDLDGHRVDKVLRLPLKDLPAA